MSFRDDSLMAQAAKRAADAMDRDLRAAFETGRASFERDLAASGKVVVDRELLARLTDYANDLGAYALPGTWALIRTDYEATLAVLTTPDGAPDV